MYALLVFGMMLVLMPFVWLFVTSFKNSNELYSGLSVIVIEEEKVRIAGEFKLRASCVAAVIVQLPSASAQMPSIDSSISTVNVSSHASVIFGEFTTKPIAVVLFSDVFFFFG